MLLIGGSTAPTDGSAILLVVFLFQQVAVLLLQMAVLFLLLWKVELLNRSVQH